MARPVNTNAETESRGRPTQGGGYASNNNGSCNNNNGSNNNNNNNNNNDFGIKIDNNSPSYEGFPQLQIPLSQDNLNIEDKEEMSPNIEIKNEQNMTDSNDILGVFDQLDAQLFGKYLPLNYPSE